MIYGKSTLKRKCTTDGYVDEMGDFVPGNDSWGAPVLCDAEPNGRAIEITLPDGTRTRYSYTITLESWEDSFSFGDEIMLSVNGQPEREYKVLGYHRYSLTAKIWV